MDDNIIAIFCLCDDRLKAMHHHEDRQCQMNDAAMMTTAFIASYGQTIRTQLPTGGYASTIACAAACLPLPSDPYVSITMDGKA